MTRVSDRIGRARYAAAQSARVAWYMAHYVAARRLSKPFDRPGEPKFRPESQPGDAARIRAAFLGLFAKDRANIEAGLYPAPDDFGFEQLVAGLQHSAAFFKDLPKVDERRLNKRGVEVRAEAPTGRYPTYYLQNFHYQSGGWLSEDSAELYDTQVEVLFGGAADAMRRIALGELAHALKGKDQRKAAVLDAACGNGRFLEQALSAFPRLKATGLDLSPAYLAKAKQRLHAYPQVELVAGQAEAMPFEDASFAAASCIYLFHELPPRVRPQVAKDLARVIAPGGALIFADSLQLGDAPDLDQMLEYFPHGFHEPYYGSYVKENLVALFTEAGFVLESTEIAFLTKVLRFRRG
jgi:ubiquinone/menaquinone biosynthesis C-methylase UbiE